MKSTQSYGDYLKRIIKVRSMGARMEGMEMKQEEIVRLLSNLRSVKNNKECNSDLGLDKDRKK